jgi:hypothetical protein
MTWPFDEPPSLQKNASYLMLKHREIENSQL